MTSNPVQTKNGILLPQSERCHSILTFQTCQSSKDLMRLCTEDLFSTHQQHPQPINTLRLLPWRMFRRPILQGYQLILLRPKPTLTHSFPTNCLGKKGVPPLKILPRTSSSWNRFPHERFPKYYNINLSKAMINRYLSTISS